MDHRFERHRQLLRRLNAKFRTIRQNHAGQMSCGRGCARCCYGLFDISLADAARVAEGFRKLPERARRLAAERSAAIQKRLEEADPEFRPPYLLGSGSHHDIDRLVEAAGEPRCPFLDDHDSCLIYDYRPLTCMLEGLPMVDTQDGLFGDWCELNFTGGIPEQAQDEFRLDYREINEIEGDVTIFIPSVICSRLDPALL